MQTAKRTLPAPAAELNKAETTNRKALPQLRVARHRLARYGRLRRGNFQSLEPDLEIRPHGIKVRLVSGAGPHRINQDPVRLILRGSMLVKIQNGFRRRSSQRPVNQSFNLAKSRLAHYLIRPIIQIDVGKFAAGLLPLLDFPADIDIRA
jgi:uncharacterized protein YwbE